MKLHIAVLPGDGIGPEVVEQALNVTKAVCEKFGHSLEYQTAPVGACAIEETGLPYPDSTHKLCMLQLPFCGRALEPLPMNTALAQRKK